MTTQRPVLADSGVEQQGQERRNQPILGHGHKIGRANLCKESGRALMVDCEVSGRVQGRKG